MYVFGQLLMYCFGFYRYYIPVFLLFCSSLTRAQTAPYTYKDLSAQAYRNIKDSLVKSWKCPKVFEEKKIQKEYEVYWSERGDYLVKSIENNDFVKDSILYPYLNQLTNELIKASQELFPFPVHLLLDRSNIPNAYSVGAHFIAVNAGLVIASKSREELSFYIAHELSHDLLNHTDNAMRQRAELVTSDEYKASLKDVLHSKYERYSRLKKLLEDHSFDRSRHSRYNESAADSLAIRLLNKAGIAFDATFFLNLDTADNIYQRNLSETPRTHFERLGLANTEAFTRTNPKGLSGRTSGFKDTTHRADSLKTHPDCRERYNKNLSRNSPHLSKTPIPADIRAQAAHIAFLDMFMNRNIGHGIYRILQDKETLSAPLPHDFLLDICMQSLLYSSKRMDRFNTLRIEKKQDVCKTYFELQEMLSQISEKDLQTYCDQRLGIQLSPGKEQNAFLIYLDKAISAANTPDYQKTLRKLAMEYRNSYPDSPYLEYMKSFF